jgi:hypothetical protein
MITAAVFALVATLLIAAVILGTIHAIVSTNK